MPQSQAPVLEAHPSTAACRRGVNVGGGEPINGSTFSNTDPGAYDQDYWYASQATFDYLHTRAGPIVRLPFRWERLQPTPGGYLSARTSSETV